MIEALPLPKTVKVLGRTVRIRPVKVMDGVLGEWHSGSYSIDIVKGQNTLDEIDTLIHELMHATLHCQGREYGGDVEETYVRALATGLLVVLRQNPKLVTYLMQDIKP